MTLTKKKGVYGLRYLDAAAGGSTGAHNRRILRSIERHGSSTLARVPSGNVDYTSKGIFRIFEKANAEYSSKETLIIKEQLQELMSKSDYKNTMPIELYGKLEKALKDNNYGKIISLLDRHSGEPAIKGLTQNAVFDKILGVASSRESGELGIYVNRTMVIGSTINQTQDLIEELINLGIDESKINTILKHQIGLFSQEAVIDYSSAASGSMKKVMNALDVHREVYSAAEHAVRSTWESKAALAALTQIHGAGMTPGIAGGLAIETLGRSMGAQHAVVTEAAAEMVKAGNIDDAQRFLDRFLPKIDSKLLEGRLQADDMESLAKNFVASLNTNAKDASMYGEILAQLDEKNFVGIAENKEILTRVFGADAKHAYSSLSGMDKVGELAEASLGTVKDLISRSIPIDPITAAIEYTSEQRKVADFLLQKHNKELNEIKDRFTNTINLNEVNKLDRDLMLRQMGDKVQGEVEAGARATGSSIKDFLGIIKKRSSQTKQKFIYDDLRYFSGEATGKTGAASKSLKDMVRATDTINKYNYHRTTLAAERIAELTEALGAGDSIDLSKRAGATLKYIDSIIPDYLRGPEKDLVSRQRDLLALLSDDATVLDEVFAGRNRQEIRGTVQEELNAIRAHQAYQNLPADFKDDPYFTKVIGERGPKTGVREEIARVISGTEDEVSGSTFTRLSKFIKDGSLKKLFTENKLFRNSTIAAGALIVGSFAYQGYKDRTQEDIQGPPLLPGGSAYEQDYPRRMDQIPEIGTMRYNPGINYKVNLYGNRNDVDNFRQQAMGLGKFNMNTTMYRRAPQLGKDPYREVASSF